MFEMSPFGTNTGVQTLPPLIDGVVNDALLDVGPDRDQTPLKIGQHLAKLWAKV